MSTLVNIVLAAILSFLGAEVRKEKNETAMNTTIQCQQAVKSNKAALFTKNETINCK
ncbi:hypothetical protein [Marixanthomonas spongiae]|uniref:hypothetical protein n=1 Tax=Marixanthomonas spongiae TaxID=2174845 RepID=UPI001402B869|nr:hypothetical protein [Marixanthomonas spongiae]